MSMSKKRDLSKGSDYQKDLEINKDALDEECLNQPSLFLHYAYMANKAEVDREKVKRKRDVVYAIVDKEIRDAFEQSGEKFTEAKIKSLVVTHERIAEVEGEYLDALEDAKILASTRDAFEQRKKSIELLCSLYGLGYFSQPRSKSITDIKSDAVNKKINKKARQ